MVLLGVGFCYGYYLLDPVNPRNFAYLIGQCLGASVVLWLVAYIVVLRKANRREMAFLSACLLFSMILGNVIISRRAQLDVQQARVALQSIREVFGELRQAQTGSGDLTDLASPPSIEPDAIGPWGTIESSFRRYAAELISLRNNYATALRECGWLTVLDPAALTDESELEQCAKSVALARSLANDSHIDSLEVVARFESTLNRLELPSRLKSDFIAGFRRSLPQAKRQLDEIWRLELAMMTEVDAIVSLARERKGWIYADGQLNISDADQRTKFNSHLMAIRKIAEEQLHIAQSAFQTTEDRLDAAIESIG